MSKLAAKLWRVWDREGTLSQAVVLASSSPENAAKAVLFTQYNLDSRTYLLFVEDAEGEDLYEVEVAVDVDPRIRCLEVRKLGE